MLRVWPLLRGSRAPGFCPLIKLLRVGISRAFSALLAVPPQPPGQQRKPPKQPHKEEQQPQQEEAEGGEPEAPRPHDLRVDGELVWCFACRRGKLGEQLQPACWTMSSCPGRGAGIYDLAAAGRCHETHTLVNLYGLAVCLRCGRWAKQRVHAGMAEECRDPARHGALNLAALRRGEAPRRLAGWPEPPGCDTQPRMARHWPTDACSTNKGGAMAPTNHGD